MIKEDIEQITDVKELQRLYIELNDEFEKQEKEIEKLEIENNLLKQLVGNNKQYTTGIRQD